MGPLSNTTGVTTVVSVGTMIVITGVVLVSRGLVIVALDVVGSKVTFRIFLPSHSLMFSSPPSYCACAERV